MSTTTNDRPPPGPPDEPAQTAAKRLQWRSRRGMLELELALLPFVEKRLPGLCAADRACYARLLEHEDWDIYDWVQGRGEPDDGQLAALVAQIRAAGAP